MHYSPYNGKVLPGYMFTDNGFWDTFRAVFPFFTFMHPTLNAQIMEGLANTYNESGWLPEWGKPGAPQLYDWVELCCKYRRFLFKRDSGL